MSASLQTTNYKLPYFGENDITDWSAYNESMEKIDTQLFANASAAANASNQIDSVQDALSTLTDSVTAQQHTITNIQTQTANNTSNINLINQMDIQQNNKIQSIEDQIENFDPAEKTTITPNYLNSEVLITGINGKQLLVPITAYTEKGYTDSAVAKPEGYKLTIRAKYEANNNKNGGDGYTSGTHLFYLILDNTFQSKTWTIQEVYGHGSISPSGMGINFSSMQNSLIGLTCNPLIINKNGQLLLGIIINIPNAISSPITSITYYAEFEIYFEIPKN